MRTVKAMAAAKMVAVISSAADLTMARRLRRLPDLFELRLDALVGEIAVLEQAICLLPRPVIITARHPREGGSNNLSVKQRRDLLLRYLPSAAFIDVELRSCLDLRAVLESAERAQIKRIISLHELTGTFARHRLDDLLHTAERLRATVVKVATRTDSSVQLSALLEFFDFANARIPTSAMGIGRFGAASRRMLARRGSALNYAHLGVATAEGQLSLAQLRRVLREPELSSPTAGCG